MSGLNESIINISKYKSISAISNLFKQMGYNKAKVIPLDKTQYELPPRANELIQEFSLICDYDKQFQIYFVKTPSMRRTDFRTIIEPFYRRFPNVNTLFIFTNDFSELAFVSPLRIPFDTTKIKILLRTLYLDPSSPYHTDLEVLEMIRINPDEQTPDIIWQKHKTAFDVERVTKEFFEAYKNALNFIRDEILIPQNKADYSKCHSFAQQLLSRIMFLYYLQKKGWLKWKDYVPDKRYIKNLWQKYKEYRKTPNSFYSEWLFALFFYAFNKKHDYLKNDYSKSQLPEEIKESFILMPFLNGGLFTPNELDEIGFEVPDIVFEMLFDVDPLDKNKGFFERFNFTVREDTPLEVEVAVDPEMLGKVYESLIAEEERQKSGIFYTPRVEIDLMCRLSLVEYLFEETKIPKDDLISLIFEPEEINNYHNIENLRKIKSALDGVKIVDPCVGSASFLVGMMNVLVEIHSHLTRKLEGREENLFALKQKIILENLYGVDVKDWAVMVGELRLWLSLIIETDEKYMNIYTKPLLPNLSFKMRQGDSLVEEIAGQKILLRTEFGIIFPSLKNKIQELIDKKAQFFSWGRSADLKEKFEIEKLENEIFKGLIEDKISELDRKIQTNEKYLSSQQVEMYGTKAEKIKEEKERLKKELEQLRKEVQNLEEVKKTLEKKTSKDYFFWEIDFAEVFAQKGGFDIVIGNPPYVRQEMIAYPLDREEDFSEDEWRERKREYKEKLVESVQLLWENVKIDKRSDLYVYFYYHGLSILKPGGIFCFINSNSWLDVGYGAGLQEFLLKNMKPIYVIDNIAQRTFEADINTVIVLIKRPKDKSEIKDDDVLKFVAFKKPFEEISRAEVFKQIEKEEKFTINEIYRVFPKKRIELLEEGVEIEEEIEFEELQSLRYTGNKWGGKYLRAPEIFFKILEKGKDKLVRLGDIAEVKRGFTTGANEFFYLEPTGKLAPKGLLHVKNSAGWEVYIEEEFLKPVIKSPRELKTILVREEDLRYKVFMCHKSKEELKGTYALEYIKWGEKQGYHKRPTCASRPRWWDLGMWKISKNILPMFERERNYCFYNECNSFIDAALYWCYSQEDTIKLNILLNSMLFKLWKELLSRPPEGGGGGPIQMKVYHYNEMLLPIDFINSKLSSDVIKIHQDFINREIHDIFEELGFPKCNQKNCKHPEHPYEYVKPEEVSFDRIMPDRRELDKIVFEALGLTEEEQLEVYRAVLELVKNRLLKAKSK